MKIVLALAFLLVACAQVENIEVAPEHIETAREAIEEIVEEVTPPEPSTIVAFGDSLTAGYGVPQNETYPAHLERALREKGYDATVINEGVSGEESAETLQRLNDALAHNPDIVILETGVNDILRGVPTNETRANIETVITELQANNITVILAGMEAFGTYQGFSFEVQTMYPGIAAAHNVSFIPFFLAGVAGMPEYNLGDYVHPNGEGYRIIAEQNVLPAVEPHLQRA